MSDASDAIEQMVEVQKVWNENHEFFNQLAKMIRHLVDALEKNGFSRDEAINLAGQIGAQQKGA